MQNPEAQRISFEGIVSDEDWNRVDPPSAKIIDLYSGYGGYRDVTGATYVESEEWDQLHSIRPGPESLARRIKTRLLTWQDAASSLVRFEHEQRFLRRALGKQKTFKLIYYLAQTTAAAFVFASVVHIYSEAEAFTRPKPQIAIPEICKILDRGFQRTLRDNSSAPFIDEPHLVEELTISPRSNAYLEELNARDKDLREDEIHPTKGSDSYTSVDEAITFLSQNPSSDYVLFIHYLNRKPSLNVSKRSVLLEEYFRRLGTQRRTLMELTQNEDLRKEFDREIFCLEAIAYNLKQSRDR